MVSLIMLYSDESIEESKALIKHIKYYVKPDGSLMTSPDIPPAEMLIKHLTGTFNSNQIVLSLSELISNTSKEFVYEQIISIYSKSYKSKITTDTIDKWVEENDNLYFLLDSEENVYSFIRYKYFNKVLVDKEYKKYGSYVHTDYFILIENICSISKGKGMILLSNIHNKIHTGIDSLLLADNPKLITYFNTIGYFKVRDDILIRLTDGN